MVPFAPSTFVASLVVAITLNLATMSGVRADGIDLKVEISGLRNYKGSVAILLWADSDDSSKFPDPSKVQFRDERGGDTPCDFSKSAVCRRTIENLQNLTVSYTFQSVPPGDYAVFAFHDENNNGILDTGFLKRPLEARGYSVVLPEDVPAIGAVIKFGKARFTVNGPKTIIVGLRYPPRL
jgi:uncharacterized protein (DUF2141 family)